MSLPSKSIGSARETIGVSYRPNYNTPSTSIPIPTNRPWPNPVAMKLDSELNQPRNAKLYDSIADAWQFLLGTNFHWGYFRSETDTLDVATDQLIEQLVATFPNQNNLKVLDVGCGIGAPATYLAQKYGWQITGFSTSEQGIQRAIERKEASSVGDQLRFEVRDALDNGFADESYDAAMLLEMSHLVHDKPKLVAESVRALKKGGTIALCDLTLQRRLSAREIVSLHKDLLLMEGSFGKARLETLSHYKEIFQSCGLDDIRLTDISQQVIPTINYWKINVSQNADRLAEYVSREAIDNFDKSCDILEKVYRDGLWGYGLISGQKVSSHETKSSAVTQTLY